MNGKSGGVRVSRLAGRGVLLVALLLAVFLIALSGGVAQATAPYLLTPTPEPAEQAQAGNEDTAGMELGEEVRLDEAGFAFSPPAGWQVVDMEQNETAGMVLVLPVEDMAEANLLLIGLGPAAEVDREATSLSELAETVVSSFNDDQISFSEARELSFNGFEALVYDITGVNETGLEMVGRLVISLVDQDRAFIFLAISTADSWNEEQVQAVFDAVRLLEPAAGEEREPADEASPAALLGREVTETVGDASLTVAAPEGWEIVRQEDAFSSRIDLTLLPADVSAESAASMRLVLDLDRAGLTGDAVSLDALVRGIVPFRQALALAEGAEITTMEPEAIEVGGVEGVRVDWERTGSGGVATQGMLVLALLGAAPTSPIFIFEASAPTEEWDSGLAGAVLDTVFFEGEAQARRFTLKNDGLSFTTPAGWYVEARGLEQGRVVSLTPEQAAHIPGFFIGLISTGFESGEAAGSIEEVITGAFLSNVPNIDRLELSEAGETEVSHLPATAYDISGPVGTSNQALGRLILVSLADGRSLVIAGVAPVGEWEAEQFQSFVDSVILAE